MALVAGIMVPHPPLIVPAVGRGSEHQVQATIDAYHKAADLVTAAEPETIIITSPHACLYRDAFFLAGGASAKGSFDQFRASQESFQVEYDQELAAAIMEAAREQDLLVTDQTARTGDDLLDHGTMVPLYFLRESYRRRGYDGASDSIPVPILRVGLSGLSLEEHRALGTLIAQCIERLGRRVAFVASGDLSHKLQEGGPYGFDPAGPLYDERIMDVMGRAAWPELLDFTEKFCREAAECGHRSFTIMAGCFEGTPVRAEVLSHEDVTGVGYGICLFTPVDGEEGEECSPNEEDDRDALGEGSEGRGEDAYVRLARASLTSYITTGQVIDIPVDAPASMLEQQAGAFVSLHKNGQLRGCIGTIEPVMRNVAYEIIQNAISASTRDPRFPPVTADEIDDLEITVDVLGPTEPAESFADLDPKRYGVVVSHRGRRSLLLPNLDGVDTIAEQVSIALRKAGISPDANYKMERFEVVRHY